MCGPDVGDWIWTGALTLLFQVALVEQVLGGSHCDIGPCILCRVTESNSMFDGLTVSGCGCELSFVL